MSNKYQLNTKCAIVDREAMTFVAISENYEMATLIADIASAETSICVFPLDVKRHFSQFGVLELILLHKNTTGLPTVPGAIHDFAGMIQKCYDVAIELPVDQRSVFDLNAEVAKLPPPEVPKTLPKLPPVISRLSAEQSYAPTTVAPKAPTPRTPKIPGAAPAKGATGRVWGVADRVRAEQGGGPITKDMRAKIIAACEAEGINAGTAATQFGKWKATQS